MKKTEPTWIDIEYPKSRILAYSFEKDSRTEQVDMCLLDAISQTISANNITTNRTGISTYRHQHAYFTWNTMELFPVLQAKKISPKNAFIEVIWLLTGQTNTDFLKSHGVNYWDSWADENGELGPIYGHQMRNNNGVDQLVQCINTLATNPYDRRIIMNLWNTKDLPQMKLPPCHYDYNFQCYNVDGDDVVDLHITQRSSDSFVGVPYDFMLFHFILKIVVLCVNTYKYLENKPLLHEGAIHHVNHDFHVYENQLFAIDNYMENCTLDDKQIFNKEYKSPELMWNGRFLTEWFAFAKNRVASNISIDTLLEFMGTGANNFDFDSIFVLNNYNTKDLSYPFIKTEIAV